MFKHHNYNVIMRFRKFHPLHLSFWFTTRVSSLGFPYPSGCRSSWRPIVSLAHLLKSRVHPSHFLSLFYPSIIQKITPLLLNLIERQKEERCPTAS